MNAETNHCREVEPRRGASRRNLGTRVWHHNHKSTSNSIVMNRLYSTVRQASVSFQSKRLRRSVDPRRGAGRRNLGTRVWHHRRTLPPPIRREAAQRDKIRPPKPTKNFPVRQPPPKKRETFSQTNMAVAVQGSSGRAGGAWGGREHPPKGGSLPPPGLPYTSINSFGLRVKL